MSDTGERKDDEPNGGERADDVDPGDTLTGGTGDERVAVELPPVVKVAAAALLVAAVGGLLWLGRTFLIPFTIALLIGIAAAPPAQWLERRFGLPTWLTTVIAMLATCALTASVLAIGFLGVADAADQAGKYRDKAISAYDQVKDKVRDVAGDQAAAQMPSFESGEQSDGESDDTSADRSSDESGEPSDDQSDGGSDDESGDRSGKQSKGGAISGLPKSATRVVGKVANSGVSVVSGYVTMLLFLLFFLIQRDALREKLRRFVVARGGADDEEAGEMLDAMGTQVTRYLWLKAAISVVTGLVFGLVAWIGGLPFAMFWGFLGFALNFIPTIGPVVASVPPVIIAYVQFSPGFATALSIGLVGVQVLSGNIIEPKILGDRLDMNIITVLLCLFFWGLVWGPLGMLLAVPLTAIIQIGLEQSPSTRPIADLMSATAASDD